MGAEFSCYFIYHGTEFRSAPIAPHSSAQRWQSTRQFWKILFTRLDNIFKPNPNPNRRMISHNHLIFLTSANLSLRVIRKDGILSVKHHLTRDPVHLSLVSSLFYNEKCRDRLIALSILYTHTYCARQQCPQKIKIFLY